MLSIILIYILKLPLLASISEILCKVNSKIINPNTYKYKEKKNKLRGKGIKDRDFQIKHHYYVHCNTLDIKLYQVPCLFTT